MPALAQWRQGEASAGSGGCGRHRFPRVARGGGGRGFRAGRWPPPSKIPAKCPAARHSTSVSIESRAIAQRSVRSCSTHCLAAPKTPQRFPLPGWISAQAQRWKSTAVCCLPVRILLGHSFPSGRTCHRMRQRGGQRLAGGARPEILPRKRWLAGSRNPVHTYCRHQFSPCSHQRPASAGVLLGWGSNMSLSLWY